MENTPPAQTGDTKRDDTPQQPPVSTQENAGTAPVAQESGEKSSTPAPAPVEQKKGKSNEDDDDEDEDSDFDELDDMLDDFSKPKPSEPSKPDTQSQPATGTGVGEEDFDEEAFMKQLERDMASMMGGAAPESGSGDNKEFQDTMNDGADAFTKQLEESGIPPGDFLKQLLADVMGGEDGSAAAGPQAGASGSSSSAGAAPAPAAAAGGSEGDAAPDSFNDAIHRTINRMKESGDKATAAAAEDDSADDLVAQLLKAVEAGGGNGDDGDLTKMFMGMMEQLSTKEMLYDPIKELNDKFPPWLQKNKGKLPAEEMARYENQARIVSGIVSIFEEKGYSDEDNKCRERVWERMQEMQAAGNPPEEILANPLAGDDGGMPECPQQ